VEDGIRVRKEGKGGKAMEEKSSQGGGVGAGRKGKKRTESGGE